MGKLRSVASLEMISSCLMRIGMFTRKSLGDPGIFKQAGMGERLNSVSK